MTAPSVDEYIDKLNEIPEQVNSKLHQIRLIDKQVLTLHITISTKRDQALQKITQHSAKPSAKLKAEINDLLRDISDIHQALMSLSNKKIKLSDQVYNCVDYPTEQLNRDLSIRAKQQQHLEQTKTSKYKRPHKNHQQEFFASEPCYCYCKRPSFGLMVQCENELCDVQWFHRECINQKNLGEKWYCTECRKTRSKPIVLKTRI